MAEDRDQRIRDRAYAIWEREGRQEGRHDEHWRRAAEEIDRETVAKGAAKPGAAAKPAEGAAKAVEGAAKAVEGAPTPSKRPHGKGDPRKTAAEHGPREKPKSSSGRTAGAATKQNGPANQPADPRAAKATERAPGEANPRPKPRRRDAAAKASNTRAVRE